MAEETKVISLSYMGRFRVETVTDEICSVVNEQGWKIGKLEPDGEDNRSSAITIMVPKSSEAIVTKVMIYIYSDAVDQKMLDEVLSTHNPDALTEVEEMRLETAAKINALAGESFDKLSLDDKLFLSSVGQLSDGVDPMRKVKPAEDWFYDSGKLNRVAKYDFTQVEEITAAMMDNLHERGIWTVRQLKKLTAEDLVNVIGLSTAKAALAVIAIAKLKG